MKRPDAIYIPDAIIWYKFRGTEQQKRNLRKLANYLDSVPDKKFDMTYFATDKDGNDVELDNVTSKYNECGTVACAAGHAAICFPKIAKRSKDWTNIVENLFFSTEANRYWDWCFSSSWEQIDNTPKGASKRIRMMLRWGVPSPMDTYMFSNAMVNFYKDFE